MHKIRFIALILFVIQLGLSELSLAQNKTYTAKEALVLFKEGNYLDAEEAYRYLLKKYDRETKYNYYYGICLLQNNNDISQAVKRLKYAALKGVSRDAYYYLGRAYQLSYQFEEAIKQYERFLKYASASDIRNEKAEKYKIESEFGLQQAAKVYHLDVYRRDTIPNENILSVYHPAEDVGRVIHNKEFFESGLDPNDILYQTERGDEVYFSLKKEGQRNLHKMEKLLDGWSESKALSGINSDSDDCYPFVVIDGSIIYFSSNKPGGLGGYDLYKANYDADSKSFANPVNMGIPFNSPKDDYLFVADEFNKLAWFASNRETNDSILIVYNIKWDDSVVRNFVQDLNDVRSVAGLSLSENGLASTAQGGVVEVKKSESEAQFHFVVADTLEYSQLKHFKSDEARRRFVEGETMEFQKDSLSMLMKQKRVAYARTNSETERSMLVNDILSMEKKVYGLDEQIERSFYQARVQEQNKIKELVAAGRYYSNTQVKVEKKSEIDFEDIFIPDEYTFYTDDEFKRRLDELEKMYAQLFNEDEIGQLHYADSLYVWGNILNLESSKLLEEANDAPAESESVISVIRNKDSVNEDFTVQSQVFKAKELKLTALKLYHESLNNKFQIYDEKLQQTILLNTTADLAFLQEMQSESKEYFKEAMDMIAPINGFDVIRYEKSGAIKRTGVNVQEDGLIQYSEMQKGAVQQKQEKKATVPKTYQELQGADVLEPEPAKVVEHAFKKVESELVYKIQIGVFRNEPNAQAVAKIPPISKVGISNKDLTKYFAGKYPSYTEAQKDIIKVQEAGFAGAFIVVFKDGKQINLTEELKE
ncbi:SPOR domain-containing protein [Carboxylicivirga marina]|uniref:SPOR domain-containing protein n=1 Tax=Carboxylicivirga marina TaxID=2800988 RepID=A0ABS1HIU7_9BACT|nr:SPOR domain-containing protein [Carboxylicivirga marina]MBK3517535.1 SPOR domain-containing protein [Carboxylicivirga marina]